MIKRLLIVGIALVAFFAFPVSATAQVTLDSSSGIWSVAQPASAIQGVGTNVISSGDPVYSLQSAYVFQGTAPPAMAITLGSNFELGTFTHFNYPITGTSLTSAQLDLDLDFTIDGQSFTDLAVSYTILHNETPNNTSNPEDVVTFVSPNPLDPIFVGDQGYIIEIVGFQVGGQVVDQFITQENASNSAKLIGRVSSTQVPEPATYLTLGTLLMLALLAKRRAQHASKAAPLG
jgi:hypothetical protein